MDHLRNFSCTCNHLCHIDCSRIYCNRFCFLCPQLTCTSHLNTSCYIPKCGVPKNVCFLSFFRAKENLEINIIAKQQANKNQKQQLEYSINPFYNSNKMSFKRTKCTAITAIVSICWFGNI
jgi:hypothetical protein